MARCALHAFMNPLLMISSEISLFMEQNIVLGFSFKETVWGGGQCYPCKYSLQLCMGFFVESVAFLVDFFKM
jgi:hypothetical protein